MQLEDEQLLPRIVSQREGPSDDGTGGAGRRPPAPLRCKVENCDANLESAPKTHQRFRLCNDHIKAPVISVDGVAQRFCQQCSRFHPLSEFDGLNRTCRMMLAKNRARQRSHAQRQTSLPGPLSYLTGGMGAHLPWEQLSDSQTPGGVARLPGAGMSLPMAGGGLSRCVLPWGPGGRHPVDVGLDLFGSGLHRSFVGVQDMQQLPVQGPDAWLTAPLRLDTIAGDTTALHPVLLRQSGFQTGARALQLHADVDAKHAARRSSSTGAGCDGSGGTMAETGGRGADRSGRRNRRSTVSRRDGGAAGGGGDDGDSDGGGSEGSSSGSSDELVKAAPAGGATVIQLQPGTTSTEMAQGEQREFLVGPHSQRQSTELELTPALGAGEGFGRLSMYGGGALRLPQGTAPSITTIAMQAAASTPGSTAGEAVRASKAAAVTLTGGAVTIGLDSGFGNQAAVPRGGSSEDEFFHLGAGGRRALLQPNAGSTFWVESAQGVASIDDGGTLQMLTVQPLALAGIGSSDVVMADSVSIRPRSCSSAGAGAIPPGLQLLQPAGSGPAATGVWASSSGGHGGTGHGSGCGGHSGTGSKRRRHRASAAAAEAAQTQPGNLSDAMVASSFKADLSNFRSPPQMQQLHQDNWQQQQQQLLLMQRQVQQMRQQLQIQQDLGPGQGFQPTGLPARPAVEPALQQHESTNIRTSMLQFGSALVAAAEDGVGTSGCPGGSQAQAHLPGGFPIVVPGFGSAAAGGDGGGSVSASAITPVSASAGAGAAATFRDLRAAGGAGVVPAQEVASPTAGKTRSAAGAAGMASPMSLQSPEPMLGLPLADVFEQVDAGVDVDMLLIGTEGVGMSDSGGLPTVSGVGLTLGFVEGLDSSSGGGLPCNELAALAAEWSQEVPDCPDEAAGAAPPSQLDPLPSQLLAHQALPLQIPPPAQRPSFPGAAATRVPIPPAFNRVSDESSLIAAGSGVFSSGQYAAGAAVEAAAAAIISGGNGGGGDTQQPYLSSPMWSPGKQQQQAQSQRWQQQQSILNSSLASQASGGAGEVMSRPSDALAVSPMIVSADMAGGGGGRGAGEGGSAGTLAGVAAPSGLTDVLEMSGNASMRFQPRAMQQQLLMQEMLPQQEQQRQQRTAPAGLVLSYYPPGFVQGPTVAPRPSDLVVGSRTPAISAQEQLQQLQKHIQELQQQLQLQQQQLQQHLQKQIQLQQQQQDPGQPPWQAQQQSTSLGRDAASPVSPFHTTQQLLRRLPLVHPVTKETPGRTLPMVVCPMNREAPEPADPDRDLSPGAAISARRQRASLQLQQSLFMRTAGVDTSVADDHIGKPLRGSQLPGGAFSSGGGGSAAVNQGRAQADGSGCPGDGNSAQLMGWGRGSAGSFSWAQLLPPPPVQMFGADAATFIPTLRGGSGAAAVSSSTETSGGDHRSVTNAHQAISGGVSSDNSSRGSALAARGGLQQQQQCDVTDAAAWALQQQLMLQVSEPLQMQGARSAAVPLPATQTVISGALASSPAAGLLHAPGPALSSMAAAAAAGDSGAAAGSIYMGQLGRVPEPLQGPGLVVSAAREGAPQGAVLARASTSTQDAVANMAGDTAGVALDRGGIRMDGPGE